MRLGFPAQSIIVIKMDVANQKGMEATYEEISKTFGHLDIAVNVAGLFNDQDIQRTILVNLGGMINSTLNAMNIMSKDKGGNGGIICNMSSVVGLDPMFLVPVYAATKAGIINFTRCLSVSHKRKVLIFWLQKSLCFSLQNDIYFQSTGIKLITVCPGATITDMFTNFTEKILYPELGDESYRVLDRLHKQSAADVSRCILSALEKQENGAVYIIEGKRLFPMEMKRYWRGIEKELKE